MKKIFGTCLIATATWVAVAIVGRSVDRSVSAALAAWPRESPAAPPPGDSTVVMLDRFMRVD